jgi:toxin ParE1/3/4
MVKISFTGQARKDIKEIKQYIFLESPLQAERVTEKIITEIQKLSTYPQLGRPVITTKRDIIRQIRVFKFRIFYRERNNKIEVLSLSQFSFN